MSPTEIALIDAKEVVVSIVKIKSWEDGDFSIW